MKYLGSFDKQNIGLKRRILEWHFSNIEEKSEYM